MTIIAMNPFYFFDLKEISLQECYLNDCYTDHLTIYKDLEILIKQNFARPSPNVIL